MATAADRRRVSQYGTHLWTPQVQSDFSGGMYRDVAREAIPANGVYDSLDFLLDQPGVVRKRGGTSVAFSTSATGQLATLNYFAAVAHVFFPTTGTRLVGIGDNGALFSHGSAASYPYPPSDLGQTVVPREKPSVFIGGTANWLVLTDYTGAAKPTVWNGESYPAVIGDSLTVTLTTTGTPTGGTFSLIYWIETASGAPTIGSVTGLAHNISAGTLQTTLNAVGGGLGPFVCAGGALPGTPITITRPARTQGLAVLSTAYTGGTAPTSVITYTSGATNCPAAKLSCIHASRLVLGNTTANPNRLFFSPVVDISGVWDATSYHDADAYLTGLVSLGNSIIVFTRHGTEKFIGDTPPPGSNFSHATVNAVGCTDARSITQWNGQIIFANPTGIYLTNGVGDPQTVTEGRIGSYWRSLFTSYDPATWSIATGVLARRYLIVTILNNSRTLVAGLMCDLTSRAWWRISAPTAMMYADGIGVTDELFVADAGISKRLLATSTFLTPSATYKADVTEGTVRPSLETRPFGYPPGISAFGKGHVAIDMRDAASDNPTMAITAAPGVEATTYAAVSQGTPIAETTDMERKRFDTGKRSRALSLKFAQTNASSKTEIYSVEVDVRPLQKGAGGQ
jgi:hypothetical protein